MLCLPLIPLTTDCLDLAESTKPKDFSLMLCDEVAEDGSVALSVDLVANGTVAIKALHDLAREMFADDFFDLTVEVDESGSEDGSTWASFYIEGEVNDEGRAEFADAELLASDPYAYYGLSRSDF